MRCQGEKGYTEDIYKARDGAERKNIVEKSFYQSLNYLVIKYNSKWKLHIKKYALKL